MSLLDFATAKTHFSVGNLIAVGASLDGGSFLLGALYQENEVDLNFHLKTFGLPVRNIVQIN